MPMGRYVAIVSFTNMINNTAFCYLQNRKEEALWNICNAAVTAGGGADSSCGT